MPDIMQKIPRDILVSVKRMKPIHHEWQLGEFLDGMWNELILRGLNETSSTKETVKEVKRGKAFSVANKLCLFFLGEHQGKVVTNSRTLRREERLSLNISDASNV